MKSNKKDTLNNEIAIYRDTPTDYNESNLLIVSLLNLNLNQLRALDMIMAIRKKGDHHITCNRKIFLSLSGLNSSKNHKNDEGEDIVFKDIKALQKDACINIPATWFKNNKELYSKIHYLFYRTNDIPFDPEIHMLDETKSEIVSNFHLSLIIGADISSNNTNVTFRLNPIALPLLDEIHREYTKFIEGEREEVHKLKEYSFKWYRFLLSKIGVKRKELVYTVYLEPSPSNEFNNVRYILDLLDYKKDAKGKIVRDKETGEPIFAKYPNLTRTDAFIKNLVENQLDAINELDLRIKVKKVGTVKKDKKNIGVKILIQNVDIKDDPNYEKIQKYKGMLTYFSHISDATILKFANIMESEEFEQRMNKIYFDPKQYENLKHLYLNFCIKYMLQFKSIMQKKGESINEIAVLLWLVKNGNDLMDGIKANTPGEELVWHHIPNKEIRKNGKELKQLEYEVDNSQIVIDGQYEETDDNEDDMPF